MNKLHLKSDFLIRHPHWVQLKHHRLWFSTKTCSCYSTKTYVDNVILILKLNWISLRNICIKMCVVLNEDHIYVSQRSQIHFKDEDHAVHMSFRWVTTTLSSLRTTTCDALIVPSDPVDILFIKLSCEVAECRFSRTLLSNWSFDFL